MPVVVTGADGVLGAAVVAAFASSGEQVELRATVRDRAAVAALVSAGVRTAVSDLVDPQRLGAVLEGAHTVVHLDDPEATWELLLEAAEGSGVRRLVTVLRPGAGVPAAPYDLVVLHAGMGTSPAEVAAAVLAADRRDVVPPVQIVEV